MPLDPTQKNLEWLDVSAFTYPQRLCAAALQGLVNRGGPLLFLDYGIYDDPAARRTNEVFMDDAHWFGKYRELLGNQDQRNLDYYRLEHGFSAQPLASLEEAVRLHRGLLNGCVVWDAGMPDTANLALMLAAQEGLLPVEAGMLDWASQQDLPVKQDLRGRWRERTALYEWAFEHLFARCQEGMIACVEPGWQRPEFTDYLVQRKIFTYSLSSKSGGVGDSLLLLLAFGPAWMRELIFGLRLDGPLRRLGLALMERKSPEVRLASRLQRAVKAAPYPTIFGWHTTRDDELSLMLHISANGLRLVPSHLASNFSFHSQVQPLGAPKPVQVELPELDPQGTYLTFTLSDGDQLMMMSTGELGNWHSHQRGQVAFNWEVQPLLVELAPALLEKYLRGATERDCLVAGPSGAGYVIPPLVPHLPDYLQETERVCSLAGIRTGTFYVADPPERVLRQLGQQSHQIVGWLAGYARFKRLPQRAVGRAMFVANQWPTVEQIWAEAEAVQSGLRALALADGPRPRFIAAHLFAYRTTLADIVELSRQLADPHIHIVRADVFLNLARRGLEKKRSHGA